MNYTKFKNPNVEYEIDIEKAIRDHGFYGKDHIWNSVILHNGKLYRETVESLIFKDNQVFINFGSSVEVYTLPGGSTEYKVSDKEQAENEIHEEVKFNVKNMTDTKLYYINNTTRSWWNQLPLIYSGKYVHIFICDYNGLYKKKVKQEDLDNNMKHNGKFYDIDAIYEKLIPEHKQAIAMYVNSKKISNGVKLKIYESAEAGLITESEKNWLLETLEL